MEFAFIISHCLSEAIGHKSGRDCKDENFQDTNERINITASKCDRTFACKFTWVSNIASDGPNEGIPRILIFLWLCRMLYEIEKKS